MKKTYIILYDDMEPTLEEKFLEAIRSVYISKLGRRNMIIIVE